jgi:GNAT superfamily N-acetyltransferase
MQTLTNIEYKGYHITTDKNLMDVVAVHKWLSEESYWVKGVAFDVVKTAFDNSFCVGILKDGQQVGYARLITDYSTFGYLADVYVLQEHRGLGLSKQIMETILNLDWVPKLRKISLATKDAHQLYAQYGFQSLANPERLMELPLNTSYEIKNETNG